MESQNLLEVTRQKMMLPPSPGTFRDREDLVSYVRDFGASQGYVVTIKKSRKDRRVILGCDRGGTYRNRRKVEEYIRKRKASSRLINCPFEAIGKKDDDVWILVIKNGEHNHEPLNDMSEHPYSRRFTEEEVRQIKLMTEAGIKPRQVLNALKQSNPELQSTPRHLYNLKAKIRQGNFSEKSFKSWRPNKSVPVNTSLEASATHYDPVNVPNLIGGKFVDSQACAVVDVLNPATQEVVSQVPLTTYEEFKDAVSSAKQAFPSWKNTPVATRQHIMFKFQELIHRDIDKLAMSISREQGKTLNGAKVDVLRGLEVVEFACGMASLQMGEFVPNASNGIDAYCTREPLGVCAGICPSNFPAVISLWMFPIAVACGNTFILKTSEKSAGASMNLASLAMEAGLPDGVLNVVHGTNDLVNHICDDDDIKAISFAGLNTAEMHAYARAAARGKCIQYNMGAKNHAIIMPDASADATLDALVAAGFGATGQTCMALSTAVFVGGSLPWEEELVERAKKLKVNAGTESGADLGPVTTREAKDRTCRLVQSGVENGARLILDGRNIVVPGYEHGNFVGPTILCDVTASMECYKEEIFGPVLLCLQADSLEEAITIVNRNCHGQGASIFTTSSVTARNFQNEIEAGLVGINVPVPIALPFSSFNGSEASCAGKAGVQFYTKIKTVAQRWKDLPIRRVSLAPPPTSDNEITSRRVPLLQPPKTESDLPCLEVSPAMPPASVRDLPDPGALQSMSPTTDRDLPNQGVSSTNTQWNENTPTSESSYLPPASQWNDGTGLMSLSTETVKHPDSERVYMTAESYGNENVIPLQRSENVISSERSDAVPSTFDGLASNSGSLYAPPTHQRLYDSHQPLSVDEYPGQGESLTMPPSQRL
ncbi:methylmalonate-semialdehyde dehydrogenase [acylating], mitochondrial-like [Actinidia eriantha]|uniref:methylmalonate-semialdehyde dehydrogenase [acylating], mitochondrial-like n=1 Tax=Actinidia eriantha TaxID=165200 RepID=UPI0025910F24|nr:methylmalonate-semialdehyde dehydrogenase [acylating], mitochondrial-like [Actinidia eriantha]